MPIIGGIGIPLVFYLQFYSTEARLGGKKQFATIHPFNNENWSKNAEGVSEGSCRLYKFINIVVFLRPAGSLHWQSSIHRYVLLCVRARKKYMLEYGVDNYKLDPKVVKPFRLFIHFNSNFSGINSLLFKAQTIRIRNY